jgi:hypothetical protein
VKVSGGQADRDDGLNLVSGEASFFSAHSFGEKGPHFVWEVAERDDGEHGRDHEEVDLIVEEGVVGHSGGTLQGMLAVWGGSLDGFGL